MFLCRLQLEKVWWGEVGWSFDGDTASDLTAAYFRICIFFCCSTVTQHSTYVEIVKWCDACPMMIWLKLFKSHDEMLKSIYSDNFPLFAIITRMYTYLSISVFTNKSITIPLNILVILLAKLSRTTPLNTYLYQ